MLSILGYSALMFQRINRRAQDDSNCLFQAIVNAQTGLRMGMQRITSDPNWRYNRPNGVWESAVTVKNKTKYGTYTLEGHDPSDNDLTDNPNDPVTLTATGTFLDSAQKLEITLAPQNRFLSCLEVAMHAGGNIDLTSTQLNLTGTISANGNVSETGNSTINPDVEAVGTISGNDYAGTTTTGIAAREMPDSSAVFDYYLANGTPINVSDIVILPPPSPPPPPPNQLPNPGIEAGVNPWQAWRTTCVVSQHTVLKHSGTASLYVTARGNFQAGPAQDIAPFVQKDVTYYFEAWVYMSGASVNAHFAIDVNSSGDGDKWWLSKDTLCVADQWTLVSGTITPTWTGTLNTSTIKIETNNGDPVLDFFIDDAVMRVLPPPAVSTNILVKGDMEGNPLTDWYAIGCTVATTTIEHSGAQAIRARFRDNVSDTVGQDITGKIDNGAKYYAEAWLRQSAVSTRFRLMLKIVSSGSGTQYVPISEWVNASAPNTYVKAFGEATIPWSGSLTQAEFFVANESDAVNDMRIDDAVMYMTEPAPPPPRTIFRAVLSPNNNPYGSGTTNPQGIYVIDCQNLDVHVERSRIVGTLVLLNAGAGTSIREAPLSWAPALANFPALLVDGDFDINANNDGLNEAWENTNFNPSGTPYHEFDPAEDDAMDDTYLSVINGLIYASGKLTFKHHPVVRGTVVAGSVEVKNNVLDLTYDPIHMIKPPPGFIGPEEIRVLLNSVGKAVD